MRPAWGWGSPEQRPSLHVFEQRAEGFFGPLAREAAVPAERCVLPVPNVPIPLALADLATAANVVRAEHTWGKNYVDRLRGFRGDYSCAPDFVVFPETTRDVERILEVAEREALSVIPFGGGSSVTGGIEPRRAPSHRGVISLDMRELRAIREVDEVSGLARIECGIMGPALEAGLEPHGLTLRHYPQSFERSTLGGWIVTRAGGHFATTYTHIDEMVAGVEMVTPRGTLATRPLPASGAGPDPQRLVCGSEGILGIVTEAWMRVRRRPVYRASASAFFSELEAALDATRAIAQSGLSPSNCRLLDPNEALLHGVGREGASVLLLAFESSDHNVDHALDRALEIARSHKGACPESKIVRERGDKARGEGASDDWRASFLLGPYVQDAMIELGILVDTFETACTWRDFPALYQEVSAAVTDALREQCGGGVVTCRFSHVYPDGPAPYFTFLGKARRGAEAEQWESIKTAASDALLRRGGTITHHHAVGRVHRTHFGRECSPVYAEALRGAKRALDPSGILNPGVLLPDSPETGSR